MRLAVPPGVFHPHSDSWLLATHLRRELEPGSSIADVTGRAPGPLGPLLSARRDDLARRGLIDGDAQTEELIVVRGQVPDGRSRC